MDRRSTLKDSAIEFQQVVGGVESTWVSDEQNAGEWLPTELPVPVNSWGTVKGALGPGVYFGNVVTSEALPDGTISEKSLVAVWEDGESALYATPPEFSGMTHATGGNRHGVVVGQLTRESGPDSQTRGFVLLGGQIRELTAPEGTERVQIVGINNRGYIAGVLDERVIGYWLVSDPTTFLPVATDFDGPVYAAGITDDDTWLLSVRGGVSLLVDRAGERRPVPLKFATALGGRWALGSDDEGEFLLEHPNGPARRIELTGMDLAVDVSPSGTVVGEIGEWNGCVWRAGRLTELGGQCARIVTGITEHDEIVGALGYRGVPVVWRHTR